MKCPDCLYHDSSVLETRTNSNRSMIKRRRKCDHCGIKFNTIEKLDTVELMVRKKDNSKEPYEREKIIKGVFLACKKRPFDDSRLLKLVENIEMEIVGQGVRIVNSKDIGNIVLRHLKKMDKVAYLRFVSVCNSFDDVFHFEKELKGLKE